VQFLRDYIIRRLLLGLVVLIGVTIVTFTIARVVPSEPAARWVGPRATVEQIERAREHLGLDKPLHVQYWRYMRDLVSGDWGVSIRTHQPVLRDIRSFLPASLELCIAGMFIAVIFGIPLGVFSSVHKNKILDHTVRVIAIASVSLPTFWLGMILQLIFFKELDIIPLSGRVSMDVRWMMPFENVTGFHLIDTLIAGNFPAFLDVSKHLVLPAVTLAAYPLGLITRMIRSSMLEVLGEEHIAVGRAYGLSERLIIYRYALKNALSPTLIVIALSFAYSLAGTFLIEAIFSWPGLGYYAALSIISVDYPAIMGVTILIAILYVVLNMIVDIVQAFIDPRIKIG
jgi:peptide/nickel transport system permease protein